MANGGSRRISGLTLGRISRQPTVKVRVSRAITLLRSLAVLNGLQEYACARQVSLASY